MYFFFSPSPQHWVVHCGIKTSRCIFNTSLRSMKCAHFNYSFEYLSWEWTAVVLHDTNAVKSQMNETDKSTFWWKCLPLLPHHQNWWACSILHLRILVWKKHSRAPLTSEETGERNSRKSNDSFSNRVCFQFINLINFSRWNVPLVARCWNKHKRLLSTSKAIRYAVDPVDSHFIQRARVFEMTSVVPCHVTFELHPDDFRFRILGSCCCFLCKWTSSVHVTGRR